MPKIYISVLQRDEGTATIEMTINDIRQPDVQVLDDGGVEITIEGNLLEYRLGVQE